MPYADIEKRREVERERSRVKRLDPAYSKNEYARRKANNGLYTPFATREEKNAYARKWYVRNRDRLLSKLKQKRRENGPAVQRTRAKNSERNDVLRLRVLRRYSGGDPKCAACAVTDTDVLTLDHIFGGGKKHQRELGGGQRLHRWCIRNNFPLILQVLCANCNYKKYREELRRRRVDGEAPLP